MYINSTGYYVPSQRVDNNYFLNINGLTDEWIVKRTGIRSRSKAASPHCAASFSPDTPAISSPIWAVVSSPLR